MPDTFGIIGLTDGVGGAMTPPAAAKPAPARKKKQEQAEEEEEAQERQQEQRRKAEEAAQDDAPPTAAVSDDSVDEALDLLVPDSDAASAYDSTPAASATADAGEVSEALGGSQDTPDSTSTATSDSSHAGFYSGNPFEGAAEERARTVEFNRQREIAHFGGGEGETYTEIKDDVDAYNTDPSSFSAEQQIDLKRRIRLWNASQAMHDRNLTELNVAHSLSGTDTHTDFQDEIVEDILSGSASVADTLAELNLPDDQKERLITALQSIEGVNQTSVADTLAELDISEDQKERLITALQLIEGANQTIKDINTLQYGEDLAAFDQAAFDASKVIPTLDIPVEQGNALYSALLGTDLEAKANAFKTLGDLVDAHNQGVESHNLTAAASAVDTLAELNLPDDQKERLIAALQSEDAETLYSALVEVGALVEDHNNALASAASEGDASPDSPGGGQNAEETLRVLAYPDDIPEGDKQWVTISLTAFREDLADAGYNEAEIDRRVVALETSPDWEAYISTEWTSEPPARSFNEETGELMTDREARTPGRNEGIIPPHLLEPDEETGAFPLDAEAGPPGRNEERLTFNEETGDWMTDEEARTPERNEGIIPPHLLEADEETGEVLTDVREAGLPGRNEGVRPDEPYFESEATEDFHPAAIAYLQKKGFGKTLLNRPSYDDGGHEYATFMQIERNLRDAGYIPRGMHLSSYDPLTGIATLGYAAGWGGVATEGGDFLHDVYGKDIQYTAGVAGDILQQQAAYDQAALDANQRFLQSGTLTGSLAATGGAGGFAARRPSGRGLAIGAGLAAGGLIVKGGWDATQGWETRDGKVVVVPLSGVDHSSTGAAAIPPWTGEGDDGRVRAPATSTSSVSTGAGAGTRAGGRVVARIVPTPAQALPDEDAPPATPIRGMQARRTLSGLYVPTSALGALAQAPSSVRARSLPALGVSGLNIAALGQAASPSISQERVGGAAAAAQTGAATETEAGINPNIRADPRTGTQTTTRTGTRTDTSTRADALARVGVQTAVRANVRANTQVTPSARLRLRLRRINRPPNVPEDGKSVFQEEPEVAPRPPGGYPRLIRHKERVEYSYDPATETFESRVVEAQRPRVVEWDQTPPASRSRSVGAWEITPRDKGIAFLESEEEREIPPTIRTWLVAQGQRHGGEAVSAERDLQFSHDLDTDNTDIRTLGVPKVGGPAASGRAQTGAPASVPTGTGAGDAEADSRKARSRALADFMAARDQEARRAQREDARFNPRRRNGKSRRDDENEVQIPQYVIITTPNL